MKVKQWRWICVCVCVCRNTDTWDASDKFEPQNVVHKLQCRFFCKPTVFPNKSLQIKSSSCTSIHISCTGRSTLLHDLDVFLVKHGAITECHVMFAPLCTFHVTCNTRQVYISVATDQVGSRNNVLHLYRGSVRVQVSARDPGGYDWGFSLFFPVLPAISQNIT